MRRAPLLLPLLPLFLSGCIVPVNYEPALCQRMQATNTLQIRLLFGLTQPDGTRISDDDWAIFARTTIEPAFPDGTTTIDTTGSWRDQKTGAITHEPSRIVWIATPDKQDLQGKLNAIRTAYETQFNQQSVGLVIEGGCATFK